MSGSIPLRCKILLTNNMHTTYHPIKVSFEALGKYRNAIVQKWKGLLNGHSLVTLGFKQFSPLERTG